MAEYKLLNMKTGSISDANLKHEDDYALLASIVPDPRGEGYTYLTQGTRSQEYNAL